MNRLCISHASVILVGYCESDYTQVHCAVATNLKRLIQTVITPEMAEAAVAAHEAARVGASVGRCQPVFDLISAVGSLLQFQYQRAWIYVFDAVRYLFEHLPSHTGEVAGEIMLTLAEIYKASVADTVQVSSAVHAALQETLGTAVKTMGVTLFLQVLPIRTSEQDDLGSVHTNTCLLAPLIRDQVKVTVDICI